MLETAKHRVWHNSDETPHAPDTSKSLLPIVTEYNSFNVKLAKAWREEILKNEEFQQFRVILAYKNPKICTNICFNKKEKEWIRWCSFG